MKKTITKPDGTKVTIESDDEQLVNSVEKKLKKEIKKANEIKKIEPTEQINM